jgi:hypothetical protein
VARAEVATIRYGPGVQDGARPCAPPSAPHERRSSLEDRAMEADGQEPHDGVAIHT